MVEVDAVEDLVEFAKIERSGGTVPQLTKPGKRMPSLQIYHHLPLDFARTL